MTTTRRSILAGAALVLGGVSAALPAAADPIFAAIERHRRVLTACEQSAEAMGDAQEANRYPDGRFSSDDHPAVAPFVAAHSVDLHALAECEMELCCLHPTTIAGIAAIMAYVRECEEGPNKQGAWYMIFSDCSDDELSQNRWLLTIEEAIRSLAGRSGVSHA
jgi:hypothetical protein